jgi:hypothetical protein
MRSGWSAEQRRIERFALGVRQPGCNLVANVGQKIAKASKRQPRF